MNPQPSNPYEPVTVEVEQQGELLKVKRTDTRPNMQPPPRGTRGEVTEFSDKSRKRMLEKMARLCRQQIAQSRFKPRFITLTYPSTYPDAKTAKTHMRSFFKRLARRFDVGFVWRLEFQDRGAPHFHLLVFGLPYVRVQTLQRLWNEVTDTSANNSLDHEIVRSLNGVMHYVAKYMAKTDDDGDQGGDAQQGEGACSSMGLSVCHNCPGRFWGVWGAAHIPWAVKRVTRAIFSRESAEVAGAALAHPWASCEYGFTVFSGDAERLADEYIERLQGDAFGNDVARHIHEGGWQFWQTLGGPRI